MTDKETKSKVAQLQIVHQNLQILVSQKQHFQMQLNEIESAQKEIKQSQQTYKIIGNVMVLATAADVEKDLKEKRETLELRLKNIESQEEKLRNKSEELQKQLMG